MAGSTAEGPGPTEAYTYHLKTIPVTIPSAGSKYWYYEQIYISFPAAGSATVTLSRMSLRKMFVLFQ